MVPVRLSLSYVIAKKEASAESLFMQISAISMYLPLTLKEAKEVLSNKFMVLFCFIVTFGISLITFTVIAFSCASLLSFNFTESASFL